MSAEERRPTPLGYDEILSFDEAGQRLAEVERMVDEVRAKYARPMEQTQALDTMRIGPADNERLSQCIGILLPLSMQKVVQEEIRATNPENMEDALIAKIASLQAEALMYLSGFENSGVRMLDSSPFDEFSQPAPKPESRLSKLLRKLGGG